MSGLSRLLARMAAISVLVLLGVAGPAASAAFAEDPDPITGSGYVDDRVGVLTSDEVAAAESRLQEVAQDSGARLWVVYVATFDNPDDAVSWADDVAISSGLGDNQYLLAIATEDRNLYISSPQNGDISESRVASIQDDVIDALSASGNTPDWASAVTVAADGFTSGGGVSDGLIFVLIGAAIAAVVVLVVLISRKKSRGNAAGTATAPAARQAPLEEVQREAAAALIATDDGVRSSEQELGFAAAQFGDDQIGPFQAAITAAKEHLTKAFERKQLLDDETPDTPEQTRAWNEEIIAHCREAQRVLDEQSESFDDLRKLEQNAPAALQQVQQMRQSAAGYEQEATAALAAARATYGEASVATVVDNPQQVAARLDFADDQLAAATTALGAGNSADAAVAITQAEQAIDQARRLDTSIDELVATLTEADRQSTALLADLDADLAQAKALPDDTSQLAGIVARTEQQVAAARAQLDATPRDPLSILATLQQANAEIDREIGATRERAEQSRRAAAVLAQTLTRARAQVTAAMQFVDSRRGSVGADARTRLSTATAELSRAEAAAASDPVAALRHAEAAIQYADAATTAAQHDVSGWGGGWLGDSDMFGAGRSRRSSGTDALLGGIIGGLIGSSGGRRSSGWGGGGFSGGFGGRSGGRSAGGFGGGGRASGRGGGRF